MLDINAIDDITALKESVDVECKLAQGKDGKGALPKDFWETYSAFANTEGGDVFLGLREKSAGQFEIAGIPAPQKVLDELWTNLNNKQKVSANILSERLVKTLIIDGKAIIQIHIPQASRQQKPIYIKGNPLLGTYRRFNSTDQIQSDETVKRLLAEQVEDSSDTEILTNYGMDDLDIESLQNYRQRYINRQPDHPFNHLNIQEFLNKIGGWRKDRETGMSGLTRAGLLMFGHLAAIKEAFPNYMLDYQERPEAKTELRWVDRLTLDGSWSGNVFEFYLKVIRKLTSELKVPFQLDRDERQDDTPVHRALREALVNTLVHADYTGRASILVVKRPDMFGFRNPGLMRVPVDIAIAGGHSDCRNHLLQDMFRYIGLGENAGSGLPKILSGWNSQHWRQPKLNSRQVPSDQVLLELHMLSLVPEKVLRALRTELGDKKFNALTENERLILVTAHIETTVDHGRMMDILDIHPRDLSSLFARLVEQKLLIQEGSGRGTLYCLPSARIADLVGGNWQASSGGLGVSSGGLNNSSGGLNASPKETEAKYSNVIIEISSVIANRKKAPKTEVESAILKICQIQEMQLEELAKLLDRSSDTLRKGYLQPLLKEKKLRLKYPTKPSHPQQAYLFAET